LEGAVIVGSILLAFGIDAAWDRREQDQRRDALLAALGSDMALARDEIDRVAGFHLRGLSAAADLLNLSGADPIDQDERNRIDSLVTATWSSTATYDAPLGAFQILVGSGNLDLLSDPPLAIELTAFPSVVADLEREQRALRAMALELHEYLGTQGVDLSLTSIVGFDEPWESAEMEAYRLVTSPRLRGIVSMLWYRYHNTTTTLGAMRDAITRIESRL
jgi:hypothetical protein